ncbi:hypothetical protein QAD02_017407 [Eretmocerus hayati]|uniref:Uncharacterized protein n=1 Tax=Eretmocerus hayati TaxID=131215 RepID=A0ACC2PIL4_9HYME|nr:hypothetical protein QAD02_017407 [Eretmocerus hayati]
MRSRSGDPPAKEAVVPVQLRTCDPGPATVCISEPTRQQQASALSYSPPEVTSALNIGYADSTDGSSAPIPLVTQPADTTWQPPTLPENLQILISELGIEVTPQDPCQESGGFDMPSLDSDDGSIASTLAFRPSACGDPDEWANPIYVGMTGALRLSPRLVDQAQQQQQDYYSPEDGCHEPTYQLL